MSKCFNAGCFYLGQALDVAAECGRYSSKGGSRLIG
jgi:hypothetical protein